MRSTITCRVTKRLVVGWLEKNLISKDTDWGRKGNKSRRWLRLIINCRDKKKLMKKLAQVSALVSILMKVVSYGFPN